MEELKHVLRKFVEDRAWERFHEPKDLALAIAIEAGELGEHFLWKGVDEAREHVRNPVARAAIQEEIADIMIYCLNLVIAMERLAGETIDVEAMITNKVARNEKKYPADVFRNKARLER